MRGMVVLSAFARRYCFILSCILVSPAFAAISIVGAKSVSTGSATAASLAITPITGAVRADLLVAQLTHEFQRVSMHLRQLLSQG